MSIKAMTQVWDSSKQKGSGLLLLLAIASYTEDGSSSASPSVSALAAKIRMSARQTQRLLKQLAAEGELIIHDHQGPKGTNGYELTLSLGGCHE